LVLKTVTFYFIYCLFIQGEVAEMQNLRRSSNSVLESFFQDGKTAVNVEILLGTWSNGSSGFSLDSVDVIGILYFLECLNDGEYIWMGVLNLPLQLTMSCSMLFVVQGSSVPK
jgi:hypothetical protein